MASGSTLPDVEIAHESAHRVAHALVKHWVALALGGVFTASLALRLATLSSKSLWIDETFSIGMATQSWPSFIRTIVTVQPNMELYYVLLKLALTLTPAGWHDGEFFWRFIPAVAGAAIVFPAFALARRLFGERCAWIAALLIAINAYLIEYSQQARGYTLFVLLLTASYLALARWLAGERHAIGWYAALCALGFLTQAFEVVFLTAQLALVTFVWWWRARRYHLSGGNLRAAMLRPLRSLGLALIPLVVVLLIRYPLYAAHPDQVAWIQRPTTGDLIRGVRQFVGGDSSTPHLAGTFALIIVVLSLIFLSLHALMPFMTSRMQRFTRNSPATLHPISPSFDHLEAVALIISWFVLPIVLTWLGSQVKPVWVTRYLAPCAVPACLAVAAASERLIGWVRSREGRVWLTAGVVAALLAVWLVPMRDYLARPGWEDWRGAAQAVNAAFQPGDGVICYDNQWGCDFGFSHYFATLHGAAAMDPTAPGAFSWDVYSRADREAEFARAVDPQSLAPYLAQHGRVWLLLGHYSNGSGDWQAALTWLDANAHLVSASVATGDIRLYLYESGGNHTDVNDLTRT